MNVGCGVCKQFEGHDVEVHFQHYEHVIGTLAVQLSELAKAVERLSEMVKFVSQRRMGR